jgi:hypothetical protein
MTLKQNDVDLVLPDWYPYLVLFTVIYIIFLMIWARWRILKLEKIVDTKTRENTALEIKVSKLERDAKDPKAQKNAKENAKKPVPEPQPVHWTL